MSEHDQTRSNQNNLEETGKQIGNLIADDMDMDPENEMEVDPAEEVTVSGEKPSQTHWPPGKLAPRTLAPRKISPQTTSPLLTSEFVL